MLSKKVNFTLSRQQTLIMRGVSIMFIMLHNLFHQYGNILSECEFSFAPGIIKMFFEKLKHGSEVFGYDMISFLGWYGVPVFIFLSGYGLTLKYGKESAEGFKRRQFIRRNWVKLFMLMILGVCIFTGHYLASSIIKGDPVTLKMTLQFLIPITQLNDLVEMWLPTVPGVYWYFGLAFELYVIYAFVVHGKKEWIMWSLTGLCYLTIIAVQIFHSSPGNYELEIYLRHNFTGWMLPFALGVCLARHPHIPLWGQITGGVISFGFFLPSIGNIWSWQLSGVFSIVMILCVSLLFAKIPYWNKMWIWIGRLSAYLFVAHPITRHFLGFQVFDFHNPDAMPNLPHTMLYIVATFLLAIGYRWVVEWLRHRRPGIS